MLIHDRAAGADGNFRQGVARIDGVDKSWGIVA